MSGGYPLQPNLAVTKSRSKQLPTNLSRTLGLRANDALTAIRIIVSGWLSIGSMHQKIMTMGRPPTI
jgi:hypothetical protein